MENLSSKLASFKLSQYMSELMGASGKPLTCSKQKTPFLGFLATMQSLSDLATRLQHQELHPFQYVRTCKFSQDHFELLFSRLSVHPIIRTGLTAARSTLHTSYKTASTTQCSVQAPTVKRSAYDKAHSVNQCRCKNGACGEEDEGRSVTGSNPQICCSVQFCYGWRGFERSVQVVLSSRPPQHKVVAVSFQLPCPDINHQCIHFDEKSPT